MDFGSYQDSYYYCITSEGDKISETLSDVIKQLMSFDN
jgi:hypothetical protein